MGRARLLRGSPLYLKIAWRNVRRSVADYSVYFATITFAACLLYSFTSSTDYLLALDLGEAQRSMLSKAGDILQAFSTLAVLVFAFLITYANRFILRRRSHEFGTYGLLGMEGGPMALILALEGTLVGTGALAAGLALGCAASPLFGAVAAFVFGVPWKPVLTWSSDAALWTTGSFAAVMALATLLGIRTLRRRSLNELIGAACRPDRPRGTGRLAGGAQLGAGLGLLALVWGTCLLQPALFIGLILPYGVAGVVGTGLVFRYVATRLPDRLRRRHPSWYWTGLRSFVLRQVESKVCSSANALACVCVLIAVAVCLITAGLAFSVGLRENSQGLGDVIAPLAFVSIFYGAAFLVAAAAVLALQQLSEAADSLLRYRLLDDLGTPNAMRVAAVRAQVGVYFVAPIAFALVHDAFGMLLVLFLSLALGATQLTAIIGGTVGGTLALMGAYYLITARQCVRMLGR